MPKTRAPFPELGVGFFDKLFELVVSLPLDDGTENLFPHIHMPEKRLSNGFAELALARRHVRVLVATE